MHSTQKKILIKLGFGFGAAQGKLLPWLDYIHHQQFALYF